MSSPSDLIKCFYDEVWNQNNEDVARAILHPDFQFRGSLGTVERGVEGFISYMRSINNALAKFYCTYEDIIEEGDRAAVRVEFSGQHTGIFYGASPTNRTISWPAAAFFTVGGNKIINLWILGDVDAVKSQLREEAVQSAFL